MRPDPVAFMLLCGRPNIDRIAGFARLFLSFVEFWGALTWKTKEGGKKTKIGINIYQGWCNQCQIPVQEMSGQG